jgi:hypothetical protein
MPRVAKHILEARQKLRQRPQQEEQLIENREKYTVTPNEVYTRQRVMQNEQIVPFSRMQPFQGFLPKLENNIQRMPSMLQQRQTPQMMKHQMMEWSEDVEGEGFFDFFKKRDPNINPPKVREILEKIGNERIRSIKLVRKPIQSWVRKILNLLSFGKLQSILNKLKYDELFHLGMILNTSKGDFLLDKREVIHLEPVGGEDYKSDPNGAQFRDVDMGNPLTINQLLENTQKFMGNKYGDYDASNNNCQVFIYSVLKANGLGTQETYQWVMQDTVKVFSEMPAIIALLSKASTNLAAVANKVMQGEGEDNEQDMEENFKRQDKIAKANKSLLTKAIKKSIKDELIDMDKVRKNPNLTAREKLLIQLNKN